MTFDLFEGKIPEILIADDTLNDLKLLSEFLSDNNYGVRSVTNGTLALASVRKAQPDLILLDITMPDLSGYEVCRQLKQDPKTEEIPVIFISALHEPLDRIKAFTAGGVDYITKPYDIGEVLARIECQLARHFTLNQIQKFNNQLEQRVKERTTQLTQINQSLQQEIEERKKIEQSLRESQAKFNQISQYIQEVFWLTNYDLRSKKITNLEYVNPAFEDIWGISCESVYNDYQKWIMTIHEDDRQRITDSLVEKTIQGVYDEEYRIVRPDGTVRWIHDRGFPVYNDEGKVYRVAGIAEDITTRKQAELERDRFFNISLDLLFITNEKGNFKTFNPAWELLLSYNREELQKQSFWDLIHPEDQPFAEDAKDRLNQGETINNLEIRYRCRDGSYLWIAWNAVPFPQEKLIYGAGRNITLRKQSEARLVYETLHDSLTGLENRTSFMQKLEIALKKRDRQVDNQFAVLFIDLDNFKQINDTLGHSTGDQLLIKISHLLKKSVRELDSVARLGGDEFIILLEDIEHWNYVTKVVKRIQNRLKSSFQLGNHQIFTGASIGVVFSSPEYQEVNEIVRDADIAMYRAKNNGKNCFEIFNQEMYAQTMYLVQLEKSLSHAITKQELYLVYQPIINLKDNMRLEGFEVLLRWHNSEKGLIPTPELISIAEDTGMINEIGQWVLRQACLQFKKWCSIYADFTKLYFSVNISGSQLRQPHLADIIQQILRETQVSPHCLRLEITETSLIENSEITIKILQNIQDMGIQISLDDFGTGFSSLKYLHLFPIDIVKIDRSFIEKIELGNREHSITNSIITLAQALNLKTVAEGIETKQQLKELKELDCNFGQGYLFSKPISPEEVNQFLKIK